MATFIELYEKQKNKVSSNIPKDDMRVLALDPGHTTGWGYFEGPHMCKYGQAMTLIERVGNNEGVLCYRELLDLLDGINPNVIVCEDYRVYAHKVERHVNSRVPTLHLIGAIELWAYLHHVPVVFQMASTAKGFVTDDKLKAWGLYKEGMRHSRDAFRHACYFLLFGGVKDSNYMR